MQAPERPLAGTPVPGLPSEPQVQLLDAARGHRDRVRGATRLAAFNGWSMVVCAVLSVPIAIVGLGSPWAVALLAIFGAVELHGRKRLLAYAPGAGRLLAGNQLALLVVVLIYCGLRIHGALDAELTLPAEMSDYAELAAVMKQTGGHDMAAGHAWLTDVYRRVMVGFYGGLAVSVVLVQGASAFYYNSRERHLRALRLLPAWAKQRLEGDWAP